MHPYTPQSLSVITYSWKTPASDVCTFSCLNAYPKDELVHAAVAREFLTSAQKVMEAAGQKTSKAIGTYYKQRALNRERWI